MYAPSVMYTIFNLTWSIYYVFWYCLVCIQLINIYWFIFNVHVYTLQSVHKITCPFVLKLLCNENNSTSNLFKFIHVYTSQSVHTCCLLFLLKNKNWSYMWVSMHRYTRGQKYTSESLYMIVKFVCIHGHIWLYTFWNLQLGRVIQVNHCTW